ncbi:MAG: DUF4402 domain-containing protein [Alphaproteobacteria bacterium]|nr:DUF4402 domain-containing protein [Alphaproteobacteria bacterium]
MKKLLLILMGIGLFCTNANASLTYAHSIHGYQRTAIANVSATIVSPVSAEISQDLDLGMIQARNKGFVSIDKNNQRHAEGLGLATSKPSSGVITLSGPNGQVVTVNVPEVRFHGEINKIAEFKPSVSYDGRAIALNSNDGKAEIRVGGTLKLNDIPESGNHKGYYVMQMSY